MWGDVRGVVKPAGVPVVVVLPVFAIGGGRLRAGVAPAGRGQTIPIRAIPRDQLRIDGCYGYLLYQWWCHT